MAVRWSVIIPTFDRPLGLRKALDCASAQTATADEIIVVDNGFEPVELHDLPREVRLARAPTRAGAAQARNVGASIASGSHLAFLDDDDLWAHDYLERMAVALMQNPLAVCITGALHDMSTQRPLPGKNEPFPETTIGWLRRNPGFVGSNIVIARDTFLSVGGFDPKLIAGEDTDLGIRLHQSGANMFRNPAAVARYNIHQGERLTDLSPLMQGKKALLRKHIPNPVMRALLTSDYYLRLKLARRHTAGTTPTVPG